MRTLNEFERASMTAAKPVQEFGSVADRGRQEQQSDVRRQKAQRQLPDDATLGIGEAVKLIHDHGRHLAEVKGLFVQEAIEQDLRNHDEDAGARIDFAIAGDQADIVRGETPADGEFLEFIELLLGERNEGRGVIGNRAGVQRLEQGGIRDHRFARARRSAEENALLGREPGEQRFLLHRIGSVGQLFEVTIRQFGPRWNGHGSHFMMGKRSVRWYCRNATANPRNTVSNR